VSEWIKSCLLAIYSYMCIYNSRSKIFCNWSRLNQVLRC